MSEEKRITVPEAAKKTDQTTNAIYLQIARGHISVEYELSNNRGFKMVLLSEVLGEKKRNKRTRKAINFRISTGTRQRLEGIAKTEGLSSLREVMELITARAWDTWYAPKEETDVAN